jgi:hypothetical protein
LHNEAESALDPVKRAALYIKKNDLVVQQRRSQSSIALVWRQ